MIGVPDTVYYIHVIDYDTNGDSNYKTIHATHGIYGIVAYTKFSFSYICIRMYPPMLYPSITFPLYQVWKLLPSAEQDICRSAASVDTHWKKMLSAITTVLLKVLMFTLVTNDPVTLLFGSP